MPSNVSVLRAEIPAVPKTTLGAECVILKINCYSSQLIVHLDELERMNK